MENTRVKNYLEKRFTINEAAHILALHPLTVRRKLKDKSLGFYKLGGKVFIGESHLSDFLTTSEHKVH